MVGGMGLLTAAGAKATVQGMFLGLGRKRAMPRGLQSGKMDLGGIDGKGG